MGFLPRDPLFRDDTKGGASPPLETPAYPLVFLFDGGSAPQGLQGGSNGGRAPLASLRGVVLRRGTQSKVSPSYAPFCLLFRRGKSRPGPGGGAPEKKNVGPKAPPI